MEEEEDSSNPKPLFPLSSPSPLPTLPSVPTWLSNPSFTPNLPVPETPLTFSDDEPEPQPSPPPAPLSYDLLPSSDEEEERNRRRRKRRRRDREKERERDGRKSRARAWEKADDRLEKEYYFDVKGDPDNLAFGSIYRVDIARYKRHTPPEFFGSGLRSVYRRSLNSLVEVDVDVLDDNLKTEGRYWSKRYSALERRKDFKHVKITSKNSVRYGEEYICLDEPQTSVDASLGEEDQESWDDEIIMKTREFNRKTRDFPRDEKVWIDFADFQDKLASMQPQKAARLQTLEKKISILEKAVELNPESEELLISLLKSYERRDSGDVLMGRWENALVQHFGSYKLWKEFLLVGQSEFSRFKVSEMRKRYTHAIRALSSAWSRMSRQICWASKPEQIDSALVQLELGLVDIFVSLCRFEWQSGYQELATGLFQAQIEYCLLCPSLDLTSQSKLRLFEHFWNSNVPRVGEDDAIGWSTWIEKEEESRKKISAEDPTHEMDGGGWTGWFKPLSEKKETNEECMKDTEECNKDTEDFLASEDVNESMDVRDAKPEDDTEELLKKLGITVDAEPHSEVQDTVTWNRWSKEESSRDLEQWMPIRENTDKTDEEQLSRTVLFEDVRDYLFSLCSKEARICLVSRFIDFFGGKVSQWTCTNSPWWMENNLSVDVIPRYILEHLKGGPGVANEVKNSNQPSFDILSDASNAGERTDINKFLRNSLFLCLTVFPRNFKLEEALLFAEELSTSQSDASSTQTMPSQSLAKRLLKDDRQNLLLSGLYAQREAAHGNLDRARKIFDMTLLLIDDMPLDVRENRALLCFWYAQMEVESSAPDRPPLRAIHVLSCLGTGEAYVPFSGQLSSLQLLKARNGYKEHIRYLGSAWAQGSISDQSVALVCAALLFEILTSGFTNATEVVEHAFSMTLPERRSYSLQLESLHVYYIKLLLRHINGMKLSQVWSRILKCLQAYPDNPDVLAAFIKVGSLCAVSQKIRLTLDEYCQRKSSIVVLLFALLFEFQKSCSRHRIRGLFERALVDDKLQKSAILWRCYLAFEIQAGHDSAAKRIFFRAIHACPWSKKLWLDGFQKLNSILTASELSDLHEVMRDKELNLRTDIYEILLQDEFET